MYFLWCSYASSIFQIQVRTVNRMMSIHHLVSWHCCHFSNLIILVLHKNVLLNQAGLHYVKITLQTVDVCKHIFANRLWLHWFTITNLKMMTIEIIQVIMTLVSFDLKFSELNPQPHPMVLTSVFITYIWVSKICYFCLGYIMSVIIFVM